MITLDDVRAAAFAVVEVFGAEHFNPNQFDDIEFDDPGPYCVYTSYSGQHCIAGQILVTLGKHVPSYDSEFATTLVGHLIEHSVYGQEYGDIDFDGMRYLSYLQGAADEGIPWGKCVEVADEGMGLCAYVPYVDKT